MIAERQVCVDGCCLSVYMCEYRSRGNITSSNTPQYYSVVTLMSSTSHDVGCPMRRFNSASVVGATHLRSLVDSQGHVEVHILVAKQGVPRSIKWHVKQGRIVGVHSPDCITLHERFG